MVIFRHPRSEQGDLLRLAEVAEVVPHDGAVRVLEDPRVKERQVPGVGKDPVRRAREPSRISRGQFSPASTLNKMRTLDVNSDTAETGSAKIRQRRRGFAASKPASSRHA